MWCSRSSSLFFSPREEGGLLNGNSLSFLVCQDWLRWMASCAVKIFLVVVVDVVVKLGAVLLPYPDAGALIAEALKLMNVVPPDICPRVAFGCTTGDASNVKL